VFLTNRIKIVAFEVIQSLGWEFQVTGCWTGFKAKDKAKFRNKNWMCLLQCGNAQSKQIELIE